MNYSLISSRVGTLKYNNASMNSSTLVMAKDDLWSIICCLRGFGRSFIIQMVFLCEICAVFFTCNVTLMRWWFFIHRDLSKSLPAEEIGKLFISTNRVGVFIAEERAAMTDD